MASFAVVDKFSTTSCSKCAPAPIPRYAGCYLSWLLSLEWGHLWRGAAVCLSLSAPAFAINSYDWDGRGDCRGRRRDFVRKALFESLSLIMYLQSFNFPSCVISPTSITSSDTITEWMKFSILIERYQVWGMCVAENWAATAAVVLAVEIGERTIASRVVAGWSCGVGLQICMSAECLEVIWSKAEIVMLWCDCKNDWAKMSHV